MKLLVDCLNAYLADTPFPGQEFEALEKVEFGTRGGVISPGKVLLEVTFSSRWKVPKLVGEKELREAEMRGYERAVSLLRQTGREELANELDRAYMGLQKSLPPVGRILTCNHCGHLSTGDPCSICGRGVNDKVR